jgi:hypothetical protein
VLEQSLIPPDYYEVFTGNVKLNAGPYSPGESPLTVIQEAADGEFPGVANVYTDRFGRLVFHGRYAKFNPEGVVAGATPDQWDWHQWKVGDGTAVAADVGGTAQLREFAFNRGRAKVITSASAWPQYKGLGLARPTDAEIAAQLVTADSSSLDAYGIRSWSAENLWTLEGIVDSSTALVETKRFAQYYVDNYSNPRNRVTTLTLKSMRPGTPSSQITWTLLSKIDIADQVSIFIGSPGGGGIYNDPYFVEGIHETCEPLNPDHDLDTVTLDLSPRAYFNSDPFPPPS